MFAESEDGRLVESRSRMISFRVTHEEFERFRSLCVHKGLRNVSEVVRLALNQLLSDEQNPSPHPPAAPDPINPATVIVRLNHLESRLTNLESRLPRITEARDAACGVIAPQPLTT